ncbi:T6SS effector BTH_I2691 family protein [Paraburkholderia graminis]|uniref:T6SS effector BTH_I2691 family protein n=1 Tax=Paraburkholderia graminis TaxID=60548 RepID=UPI003C7F5F07
MTASCPLCDRKSLLIYPVRYAVACPLGAAKAPPLSGNFKIDGRAPQSAGTARYTLRSLRQGYLYSYDEKRQRLRAYMVLDDGIMWSFPPGTLPPPGDAEQELTRGCAMAGDLKFESLGRCIDVEHTPGVDEAANLWIGWSNVLWTKALVEKASDANWRKLHMQCINVPAMLAGSATDTGEFQASQGKVAHFAMDDKAMTDAFGFSNRAPRDEIRLRRRNVAKRIGDAMAESSLKKGFIVAVNDPVAITNDLAELTVPNLNNGFDHDIYWKWMSAQLLEQAESGIRARAREMTGTSYGISKTIADANVANAGAHVEGVPDAVGLFRLLYNAAKTGSFDRALKEDERNANDIPGAQKRSEEEAWEEATTKIGPDGKRTSVLDEAALANFKTEYQRALTAFKAKWQPLVQAHADWLKSQLLAEWMAGVSDTKDIRSGFAYSESCAQAIGMAAGTEECKKVLDDWLTSTQASNIRNVYARALMFNQDDLIKAADSQVHGSDIQYENFLNIYKEAFKRVENNGLAAALRDRLVVTTANYIVATLTKGTRGAAWGFTMIRLSLQAGVRVKSSQVSKVAMRTWLLDQARELGVSLDGDRTQQRVAATQVAKQVVRAVPPSNPDVVAYELDTDALVRSGKLDPADVKGIKIAGVETTRKWLGSSAPVEFHQGVATAIFQMATLTFAIKDFVGSDQFSKSDATVKLAACIASIVGSIVETASETVAKGPTHPLAAFIRKQWSGVDEWAERGATIGRGIGAAAGIVLAGVDLFKNAPEAFGNKESTLGWLYVSSGVLGAYLAIGAYLQVIPGFWIVFIASILIAITIAIFKSAAIKDWISRCKFSKGERYDSMDAELNAFNSAVGA